MNVARFLFRYWLRRSARLIVLFFAGSLFNALPAVAQSYAGVTGIRDTSYTTYTAYQKDKKYHPQIKIAPLTNDPAVTHRKQITYCTLGKRILQLDAFLPAAKSTDKRIPIVIIHGGGWRSGNPSQHYPLAEKLAALGYACFVPEYRLSTEALFPAAVYDLKAAVRWVKQNGRKYQVDTSKLVVMGFSAGGELAAFLGTTGDMPLFAGTLQKPAISDAAAAVVDIDGTLSFVHPESSEGDDSKRTSAGTYWFGYSKKESPVLWEAASPLSYVSPATPPTLFINSSVDRMHAGRDDYRALLDQYGTYTEVHRFEDSPHSFCLYEPWFTPTVEYIDAFLKKQFPK